MTAKDRTKSKQVATKMHEQRPTDSGDRETNIDERKHSPQ